MKICAIICEYNPFHNGHLYQLEKARETSGSDAVVCIMSGNFVQRGEAAIMEKYVRAQHAVAAGADVVLELPTPFATATAELFAKGAIHLLSSIPAVRTLCFGSETAQKTAFLLAAKYLNDEPAEVSEKIKQSVQLGQSYAKARAQAFAGFIPFDLLTSPNNILGVEYTKAILAKGANIDILPIQRMGADYADKTVKANFSSASAIREQLGNAGVLQSNLPPYVLKDLPLTAENNLELLEKHAILSRSAEDIARVCDCTEGLENAFKNAALLSDSLTQTLTSARYTASRIRRIALQNLLHIDKKLIFDSLNNPLYLRVLACKKERNDVLSALSESKLPLLIRAHDEDTLSNEAKACYLADVYAEEIYQLLYPLSSSATKTHAVFI